MKIYFKGGKGIANPVDKDGTPIKEGDILTHSWWDKEGNLDIDFWHQYYPKMTDAEIEARVNKPAVIVRYDDRGYDDRKYFWGEGLSASGSSSRLYAHDFTFIQSKRLCHISDNPKLYVHKFESKEQFTDWLVDNEGKILECYMGSLRDKVIQWKYENGNFYTKDEKETELSEGMRYLHLYDWVDVPVE